MTFWGRFAGIIAMLAAYGLGVWHLHTWYDGYQQSKELKIEIANHEKDQLQANEHSSDLEKELATLRQQITNTNAQLEEAYAKVTNNCAVPADLIKLRNQAAGK